MLRGMHTGCLVVSFLGVVVGACGFPGDDWTQGNQGESTQVSARNLTTGEVNSFGSTAEVPDGYYVCKDTGCSVPESIPCEDLKTTLCQLKNGCSVQPLPCADGTSNGCEYGCIPVPPPSCEAITDPSACQANSDCELVSSLCPSCGGNGQSCPSACFVCQKRANAACEKLDEKTCQTRSDCEYVGCATGNNQPCPSACHTKQSTSCNPAENRSCGDAQVCVAATLKEAGTCQSFSHGQTVGRGYACGGSIGVGCADGLVCNTNTIQTPDGTAGGSGLCDYAVQAPCVEIQDAARCQSNPACEWTASACNCSGANCLECPYVCRDKGEIPCEKLDAQTCQKRSDCQVLPCDTGIPGQGCAITCGSKQQSVCFPSVWRSCGDNEICVGESALAQANGQCQAFAQGQTVGRGYACGGSIGVSCSKGLICNADGIQTASGGTDGGSGVCDYAACETGTSEDLCSANPGCEWAESRCANCTASGCGPCPMTCLAKCDAAKDEASCYSNPNCAWMVTPCANCTEYGCGDCPGSCMVAGNPAH